jgi:hypothetical protein
MGPSRRDMDATHQENRPGRNGRIGRLRADDTTGIWKKQRKVVTLSWHDIFNKKY